MIMMIDSKLFLKYTFMKFCEFQETKVLAHSSKINLRCIWLLFLKSTSSFSSYCYPTVSVLALRVSDEWRVRVKPGKRFVLRKLIKHRFQFWTFSIKIRLKSNQFWLKKTKVSLQNAYYILPLIYTITKHIFTYNPIGAFVWFAT